ncbi:XdhC family protein [Labrys wisconsinensis]|uniref:Xanthine dehydrogenase accessory factor n=1 Tax=Labrys wisconsinensis TaxID=425677 RepID=A0ABU0JKU0_9HYPH|nr:XdhC family protein [Labrys wisconsinensis]MDQ0474907.1 xanthine dehydrogenase accessory factor [Labrys wisconsinensis]
MKLATLKAVNAARAARRPIVLVTDVETGEERVVHEAAAGDPLAAAVAEQLRKGKSAMVALDGRRFFLTVHVPPVKLVMTGAVHISQALVPLARLLGHEPIVVDPRTAFASPERFPDVTLVAEWPDVALPPLGVDRYTAFIALTHDPKIDDPALAHALSRDCFYIGALGSRKTHARRLERLRAAGFSDAALARIHAPVGLDIGAISPAEIAVSIVAEITAALRLESGEKQARAA